jgi:hypothetical protein
MLPLQQQMCQQHPLLLLLLLLLGKVALQMLPSPRCQLQKQLLLLPHCASSRVECCYSGCRIPSSPTATPCIPPHSQSRQQQQASLHARLLQTQQTLQQRSQQRQQQRWRLHHRCLALAAAAALPAQSLWTYSCQLMSSRGSLLAAAAACIGLMMMSGMRQM